MIKFINGVRRFIIILVQLQTIVELLRLDIIINRKPNIKGDFFWQFDLLGPMTFLLQQDWDFETGELLLGLPL